MDVETLKEQIQDLKAKVDRAQLDRNQVQLDRDTIQTFYDITKKEARDFDMRTAAKDREMELMEDNHRVEVRVYIQKVKHLEYEHKNNMKRIGGERISTVFEEKEEHTDREVDMRKAKRLLKMELKESELNNSEEIKGMKDKHEKNLQMMRSQFEKNMGILKDKYEARVSQLRADLELRRKVEIHEIEERKNLHINDLLHNHEEAFNDIKKYYNDITRDNLKLIRDLKNEVAEMTKKAAANQKLMYDIAQENKRLSEPLKVAVAEVESLKAGLKDAEKDKLSLRNARARLRVMETQIRSLEAEHDELESKYAAVDKERADLYESFEATIKAVQRRSDFKNMVLERKLEGLGDEFERRQEQLQQVLSAANLDPAVLAMVSGKIDEVLDGRNALVRDLQYSIARVTKAHNDARRVYEAKLGSLGVPTDGEFGELAGASVTAGPAGLVAAPTV